MENDSTIATTDSALSTHGEHLGLHLSMPDESSARRERQDKSVSLGGTPFFLEILRREIDRRIEKNPRYSMRAFASFLGLHPSALCRVFSEKQILSPRSALVISERLALHDDEKRVFLQSVLESRRLRESFTLGREAGCHGLKSPVVRMQSIREDARRRPLADDETPRATGELEIAAPSIAAQLCLEADVDPEKIAVVKAMTVDFLERVCDYMGLGAGTMKYRLDLGMAAVRHPH